MDELEKIAAGKNQDDIVRYLKKLINQGKVRERSDRDEISELLKHLENFPDEKRHDFERNSKLIFSKILRDLKHKSLVSYNPGSSAIPYQDGQEERHFNIYEIECDNMHVTLTRKDYQWVPNDPVDRNSDWAFELQEKSIELFSLEKIHKNEPANP